MRNRVPAGGFRPVRRDRLIQEERHDTHRSKGKLDEPTVCPGCGAGVLSTTTDIHLARRIGEAVHHAYAGQLEYHYEDDEHRLRVNWARDRT